MIIWLLLLKRENFGWQENVAEYCHSWETPRRMFHKQKPIMVNILRSILVSAQQLFIWLFEAYVFLSIPDNNAFLGSQGTWFRSLGCLFRSYDSYQVLGLLFKAIGYLFSPFTCKLLARNDFNNPLVDFRTHPWIQIS